MSPQHAHRKENRRRSLGIFPSVSFLAGLSFTTSNVFQFRIVLVEARIECQGQQSEIKKCEGLPLCENIPTCVDCTWGEWGNWSMCSCNSLQERSRQISTHSSECGKPCTGPSLETRSCDANCAGALRDCELSDWSGWSECPKGADFVCTEFAKIPQSTRERTVTKSAQNGGKPCEGPLMETAPCEVDCSAVQKSVDCILSEWSKFSDCTATCGGGSHQRHRYIKTWPKNGGAKCGGAGEEASENAALAEILPCNLEECGPEHDMGRDCKMGEWSDWSNCSKRCGTGEKERKRSVEQHPTAGGKLCEEGALVEVASCGEMPCESSMVFNCEYSQWSNWDKCSATCNGVRQRYRTIAQFPTLNGEKCNDSLQELQACNLEACKDLEDSNQPGDCKLSEWSDYGECSATCGKGAVKQRSRQILKHGKNAGKACDGVNLKEVTSCAADDEDYPACDYSDLMAKSDKCEIDDWNEWGDCSTTCGEGTQERKRKVKQEPSCCQESCPSGESLVQVKKCNVGDCECTDCEWSEWSDWGGCLCLGLRERHRTIKVYNNDCGKPCSGDKVTTEKCTPDCHHPIDCELSEWVPWSACTSSCGGGQQFRSRFIKKHHAHGGAPCDGHLKETQECNMQLCSNPQDCILSSWGDWSDCSASCGGGQSYRQRMIATSAQHGGEACASQLVDLKGCNEDPCEEPQDCEWDQWSEWGGCSVSCGGGTKQRDRLIKQSPRRGGKLCDAKTKTELASCNVEECKDVCIDAKWDEWGSWSDCSSSCGDAGYSWRTRVVKQWQNHCGSSLVGDNREFRECNRISCESPRDCSFSDWTSWSDCSSGSYCNGVQERSRFVKTESMGDGKECVGTLAEIRPCNLDAADCDNQRAEGSDDAMIDCELTPFSSWSQCSVKCGGGTRTRHRSVHTYPQNGGKSCVGNLQEIESCNLHTCREKQDCELSDWSLWSKCSKSCGGGSQTRQRKINTVSRFGGIPCDHSVGVEIQGCEEQECPGQHYNDEKDYCWWEDWAPWSSCSKTCGNAGYRRRTRSLRSGKRINGNEKILTDEVSELYSVLPTSVSPSVSSVPYSVPYSTFTNITSFLFGCILSFLFTMFIYQGFRIINSNVVDTTSNIENDQTQPLRGSMF